MSVPFYPDPPLRLMVKHEALYPEASPDLLFKAPERDLWLAAHYNDRDTYACLALEYNDSTMTTFSLQSAKKRQTVLRRPLPRWSRYPAGVIVMLSQIGFEIPPMTAIICGDEPPGPRYEYALGILFAGLCCELNDEPYEVATLTEIVDRVHREYVDGSG